MATATSKVSRRESYDSMSITGTMPSGANFKFKVNRNGETIEIGFSNDKIVAKAQMVIFRSWIKFNAERNDTTSWKDIFDKLEAFTKASKNSTQFIELMKKDFSTSK